MPEAAVKEESPILEGINYHRSPGFLRSIKRNGNHAKVSTDLAQARDMQRIAHQAAMNLEGMIERAPDDEARARAALALKNVVSAWDLARDAARIARNKPLPGSLRPENVQKKKKVTQHTFAEIPPPVSSPSSSGPSTPTAKEMSTATPRPTEPSPSGFGMTEPE